MSRPALRIIVSAILACATPGLAAHAQEVASSSPSTGEGEQVASFAHDVTVTIGGGFATRSLYCDHCTQGSGTSVLFKLNRFVGATTALGIEGTAALDGGGTVGNSLFSAMGVVTTYVLDHFPLFISGGLGVVAYRQHDGSYAAGGTGFGCTGRLGYEARLLNGVSLVPYAGYVSTIGDVSIGYRRQRVSTIQVGLGVTLD